MAWHLDLHRHLLIEQLRYLGLFGFRHFALGLIADEYRRTIGRTTVAELAARPL